jgi:tripartite-type tricarboxylate transporter receptor subunit TctC
MNKKFSCLVKIFIGLAFVGVFTGTALGGDIYKGKTIRIVVGFSAGGGFDTYSRAIARHIAKHIPGKPTMVVQNMTGAGSLIAANYMFNKAKPDGLTIGNFHGGLVLQQVVGGKGVKFDARKFEWLGLPVQDTPVCALTRASGITSLEKWFGSKQPVKLGGTAPGDNTSDFARVLKEALGLPIHLVEGYRGTSKVRLAAEVGEVAGGCWSWESVKVTWRKALESGDVKVVIQMRDKKHPELSNVPNALDYVKDDDARQLLKTGIINRSVVTRYYSLPPGTPSGRVAILQKAFADTIKDPDFLGEVKKANLDINPLTGEEVKRIVASFFELDSSLVSKLKKVLVRK